MTIRPMLSLMVNFCQLLQAQLQVILRLMKLTGDPNQLGGAVSLGVSLPLRTHTKQDTGGCV